MLTLGERDLSMKNPSSYYGSIKKMLENRQSSGKFPTSYTSKKKSQENLSLASLKTNAINPQTHQRARW